MEPYWRGRECRFQPLICTDHAMAELNRQAAGDEKAKTGEAEVGILACHCGWCCTFSELAGISGANVTVSRTHSGFSLCFLVDAIQNRFRDKQGMALFSDNNGKQRLIFPPILCPPGSRHYGGVIYTFECTGVLETSHVGVTSLGGRFLRVQSLWSQPCIVNPMPWPWSVSVGACHTDTTVKLIGRPGAGWVRLSPRKIRLACDLKKATAINSLLMGRNVRSEGALEKT